jgi:uncharacterized membrane protein YdbT with pleckstrin-like domain
LGYIEENLIEGERIIAIIPIHFINYLGLILATFIMALFFYYLTPLLVIVPIILLVWGIWFSTTYEYGITNQRIIKKHGVISQNTSEIKLDRLESLTVNQSSLGRILGYGNVIANGAGSTIVFEYIPNPHAIRKQILELKA